MTTPSRIAQNVARARYVIPDEPEPARGELPPDIAFAYALMGPGRDADEPQEWPDVMAYVRETTKDLEGQG